MRKNPQDTDLRTIACAVGGDSSTRHGIILAKSTLAKKQGLPPGNLSPKRYENVLLVIVPSRFDFYIQCSRKMMTLLEEYTPDHEKFSIDETFLDMTDTIHLFGPPLSTANIIRNRIRDQLGFTVNIGISSNKLLAKWPLILKKPDKCHTLFPNEIAEKCGLCPSVTYSA